MADSKLWLGSLPVSATKGPVIPFGETLDRQGGFLLGARRLFG